MIPWISGHIISPALERLFRRRTFNYYHELMKSQWWSAEEIQGLQLEKLQTLVSTAMNGTPAYTELAGLAADWLPESLGDLARLPLLDKATLSTHRDRLTNRAVPGGAISYNTGGSSGTPLIFCLDKRRQAYDKAARMRTHEWWGVAPGDREAYIWGSPVELSGQDRLKQFRDWLTNEMLLSAFDLSEESVERFVASLHRFKPRCLFGYPSSIALMCQFARAKGLDLTGLPVKAVFSTAEVLYDHQKQIISETLGGVPVVNGYGSREGGFIAHECPEGRMHITSENVLVEFIKDGQAVEPGQDGEIVVTHLDNHAMPFIRYRTGDIGQPSDETCSCGRRLEVMKGLKGRSTDFVIAPDGRWVHGLALIYVVREIAGVRQYQIVQDDLDVIRVMVVSGPEFPPEGQQRIREGIAKRMGAEVRVDVEDVAEIAPAASGKFRYVISKIARERQALL